MDNIYAQRIEQLRSLMRAKDWDAVVLTGSDPHGSEYPALRWKQVEWLTGFTGEAGDVVITLDHAGLWTDTRYFIQAVNQLEGTGVQLHKTRVPDQVLIPEWLKTESDDDLDYTIAIDGLCVSAAWAQQLPGNVISVPDLLNVLWKDRPTVPQTPIFPILSGESRLDKLNFLREECEKKGCDSILLTALDDIAWTLNLRASDIEYNPLIISYLLVNQENAVWFVLKEKVEDPQTVQSLEDVKEDGVEIRDYSDLDIYLNVEDFDCLWIDSETVNFQIFNLLKHKMTLSQPSPVQLRKARKNDFEIEGMKRSHLRDGLAVERFLYWLEYRLEHGFDVSEWDASLKLGGLRAQYDEYLSDSFETISAYGPGAALPHYITPRIQAPLLDDAGLYLCDSGAQYTDGTTDITRTVPLGKCSRLEMEDYTLVLKGHIGLAMAVFPEGTPGSRIDALSREPLWQKKRNFGHGTGHGVGYCLCCHEGPQDVRQNMNDTPLLPGMVISDEPGIYREGRWGVRHENLLLVVRDGENDFGKWLRFEPLTLCHFDTSVIVPELLNKDEIDWLNSYNEMVYNTLSPYLREEIAAWLREKTLPLQA